MTQTFEICRWLHKWQSRVVKFEWFVLFAHLILCFSRSHIDTHFNRVSPGFSLHFSPFWKLDSVYFWTLMSTQFEFHAKNVVQVHCLLEVTEKVMCFIVSNTNYVRHAVQAHQNDKIKLLERQEADIKCFSADNGRPGLNFHECTGVTQFERATLPLSVSSLQW